MPIYKPSLLDKFKDFVNGLKGNWDQYEAHVADFESHLAESAKKHIAESGTNANGSYIKFDDGTMICYYEKNQNGLPITTPTGQIYRSDIVTFVLPATFKYAPYVPPPGGVQINGVWYAIIDSTVSGFTAYAYAQTTRTMGAGAIAKGMAIGRWK